MSTYRQFLPALLLVCLLAAGLASPVQAEPDRPPICASSIPNQMIDVGAIYQYTVPSSTFLGWPHDVITYSSTLTSGDPLPAWLTFTPYGTRINQNAGEYSGTPDAVQIIFIRTYAADDDGGVGFCEWSLTVRPANTGPVLAGSIPDQLALEDAFYNFTVPAGTFSDADTWDSLSYSSSALPVWLSFDAATQTFSGTPANENVGSAEITVTATDTRGISASDTFTLTVQNVNDAPTVASPIPDQLAVEDAPFSYFTSAATFTDVDTGDSLTFSAVTPAWLSFNPLLMEFSGTPANEDAGPVEVTLTATDLEGAQVSDIFTITVQNTNDAPLAATVPVQRVEEYSAYEFSLPADAITDEDPGDTLTCSAAGLPAWLSFDTATWTFSGSPTHADLGSFIVTVTCEDDAAASAVLNLDFEVYYVPKLMFLPQVGR